MTAVNKQDSNFTELRFAVETRPVYVPGDAVWYPLEPNSYKNFGGDVKLKARSPSTRRARLKKGVVVDLDAQGGWQQDLTQTNFQRLRRVLLFRGDAHQERTQRCGRRRHCQCLSAALRRHAYLCRRPAVREGPSLRARTMASRSRVRRAERCEHSP
jgi:hypothetical protein